MQLGFRHEITEKLLIQHLTTITQMEFTKIFSTCILQAKVSDMIVRLAVFVLTHLPEDRDK
jgi:hypothetical protein